MGRLYTEESSLVGAKGVIAQDKRVEEDAGDRGRGGERRLSYKKVEAQRRS